MTISAPNRCMLLRARIKRPRQYKWPLLAPLLQSLIRFLRAEIPIQTMNIPMLNCNGMLFAILINNIKLMLIRFRHGLISQLKARRLIHIDPNSNMLVMPNIVVQITYLAQVLRPRIQQPQQIQRLRIHIINPTWHLWPAFAVVNLPIRITDKYTPLRSLSINEILVILLYVRINDCD